MPEKHFDEQLTYAKEFVIPLFKKLIPDFQNKKILEIGCAEGGLLDFLKKEGHEVKGIELNKKRVNIALKNNSELNILVGDISDENILKQINDTFDLIIMREVIEHIPNKESTFKNINSLLKPGGYFFATFPPKYSPFAGHQQVGRTILSKVPFIHLFPIKILKFIIEKADENPGYFEHLQEHYSTGMSIHGFKKFLLKYNFQIIKSDLYLFRPIYKQRYGLPVIKLPPIPGIREVTSFGCETLAQKL